MSSSNDLELRDFEWAVRPNRVSLNLLGLWPETQHNFYEKLKSHLRTLIVSLILIFGMTFPYVHVLIKMHDSVSLVMENVRYIMPAVSCVIRVLIIWWKKEVISIYYPKAVLPLIEMMSEDWSKSKNAQDKNIMIIWAQRARLITICIYIVMVISIAGFVFPPAFGVTITHMISLFDSDNKKQLPLEAYEMYGLTEWPLYGVIYIFHAVIASCTAIAYTAIDNFLGLLVFHICGQLDILSSRLVRLDKLVMFRDGLRDCVITHMRLLRAVTVIEDTYNVILLVLFINFGILFSCYGFWFISIFDDKDDAFVGRITYVASVIIYYFVHMALYCAVGEILVTQCNRVYYTLCNLEWYHLDPKLAKQLVLLMVKTKEPCYITAGKIFPMTMVTFCSLIKTSASYMSVMLAYRI